MKICLILGSLALVVVFGLTGAHGLALPQGEQNGVVPQEEVDADEASEVDDAGQAMKRSAEPVDAEAKEVEGEAGDLSKEIAELEKEIDEALASSDKKDKAYWTDMKKKATAIHEKLKKTQAQILASEQDTDKKAEAKEVATEAAAVEGEAKELESLAEAAAGHAEAAGGDAEGFKHVADEAKETETAVEHTASSSAKIISMVG